MALKILSVVSEKTERHPLPLASKIQKSVEEFLASEDGLVLEKIEVVPNPGNFGDFGRAIVTVYYNSSEHEKKKEKK